MQDILPIIYNYAADISAMLFVCKQWHDALNNMPEYKILRDESSFLLDDLIRIKTEKIIRLITPKENDIGHYDLMIGSKPVRPNKDFAITYYAIDTPEPTYKVHRVRFIGGQQCSRRLLMQTLNDKLEFAPKRSPSTRHHINDLLEEAPNIEMAKRLVFNGADASTFTQKRDYDKILILQKFQTFARHLHYTDQTLGHKINLMERLLELKIGPTSTDIKTMCIKYKFNRLYIYLRGAKPYGPYC